ncbi:phage antirepressor KilAC domain-containing protein [Myroides odoratus]|nr:phage antirepressor KilAC domain-containing protein [Myroides odoratus]WQD58897.1 phage antirepressor KilAC domain-containing protein [Myroides odoratus]
MIDNNRMKPRDEYINKVFESSSLVQLSEAAKLLGLGIGRNTLYAVLREKKMIFQNSTEPIQYYVDKGYFVMKQELKQIPVNGIMVPKVVSQTFVTQKGLAYIAKILNVITTNQNQKS